MAEQQNLSEDWNDAQTHELEFWRGRRDARQNGTNPDSDNRVWWGQFWDILAKHSEILESAIEVGSGPTPMLACAPASVTRRTAIEPLAEKFRETGWDLTDSVQWVAEPLETTVTTDPVDLVICVNVLDHMNDPVLAISKMKDALNETGVLFLWVHTQQPWYNRIYDYLPFRRHDHMHPHSFTKRSLVSELKSAGFPDVQLIKWKAKRDPTKTRTTKERIIQKFAVSETLVIAKNMDSRSNS
jgi:hypothetical protein